MPLVFGYGSLMNPSSAAVTLGRTPTMEELRPAYLEGWWRAWQITGPVLLGTDPELVPSVFLDIVPVAGGRVNGILIPVSEEELLRLDRREFCYDRIDVSDAISPAGAGEVVYTYVGMADHTIPPPDSVVLDYYESIVAEALELWGSEFAREYHETTHPHGFPLRAGNYRWPEKRA